MQYVRIYTADDGGSRFEDVEAQGAPARIADGIPDMIRYGPWPVSEILFVEPPQGLADWEPHVAPRKQWGILLAGSAAIVTSDGQRREFGPGDVLLLEDTVGEGHGFTPLSSRFRWALIPVASTPRGAS
jgi:hypothetical protein